MHETAIKQDRNTDEKQRIRDRYKGVKLEDWTLSLQHRRKTSIANPLPSVSPSMPGSPPMILARLPVTNSRRIITRTWSPAVRIGIWWKSMPMKVSPVLHSSTVMPSSR